MISSAWAAVTEGVKVAEPVVTWNLFLSGGTL